MNGSKKNYAVWAQKFGGFLNSFPFNPSFNICFADIRILSNQATSKKAQPACVQAAGLVSISLSSEIASQFPRKSKVGGSRFWPSPTVQFLLPVLCRNPSRIAVVWRRYAWARRLRILRRVLRAARRFPRRSRRQRHHPNPQYCQYRRPELKPPFHSVVLLLVLGRNPALKVLSFPEIYPPPISEY